MRPAAPIREDEPARVRRRLQALACRIEGSDGRCGQSDSPPRGRGLGLGEHDARRLVSLRVRGGELHLATLHAEQVGWRVGVLAPGSGLNDRVFPKPKWSRESLRNPGKTLVLSELVNVKYYSMEVAGNPGAIKARP